MTNIQTMLRESADTHPQFDLKTDPWVQGRRRRRRRRFGVAAGVVAVGVLVVAVAVQGVPDMSATPTPATSDDEFTLPDTLYNIGSNVPDAAADPLGTSGSLLYQATRERGLFKSNVSAVIVAGAEHDTVRVVGNAGRAALSPDGTSVAYAEQDGQPFTLEIVNLVTGKTVSHPIRDEGEGGYVESLIWAPDGSAVMAEVFVITSSTTSEGNDGDSTVATEGVVRPLVLDVESGTWSHRRFAVPDAISSAGDREVRRDDDSGRLVVAEVDGPAVALLTDRQTRGSAQFSPDGRLVAAVTAEVPDGTYTASMPFTMRVFDSESGDELRSIELGEHAQVHPIGWGRDGVLLSMGDRDSTYVNRVTIDSADVGTETIIRSASDAHVSYIAVATGSADAPTRAAQSPSRGLTWLLDSEWTEYVLILAGAAVLAISVRIVIRTVRHPRRP